MTEQLTRTCCKCGNTKPLWDFPPNRRIKSGRDVRCTTCVNESKRKFERKAMKLYSPRYWKKMRELVL